jgi:hypothetical protein
MRNHRYLILALFLGALALEHPAAADDKETAKELFERGLAQMEAKKYDEACPAIEQSLKLDPFPGTLFTLADCEALRGRPGAAFARYGEYLQLYASLSRDKQAKQGTREKDARAKRAELEKLLSQATLTLPPDAPDGTVVTRDGIAVAAGELGAPMVLEPGEHVFTTQVPGGPVSEQRVTLEKGEQRTITLEVRTTSSAAPTGGPVTPPPSRPNLRRMVTYVTGGVGAAGLVLGAVTGGLMLAQMDAINAGCTDNGSGVAMCDEAGASAGNNAKTFGAVASAGFVAGLALAGVAVVLFVTEPRQNKTSTGHSTLPRLDVGLSPMGPLGTSLSVRGRF